MVLQPLTSLAVILVAVILIESGIAVILDKDLYVRFELLRT